MNLGGRWNYDFARSQRTADLEIPRYKIMVQVLMGEQRGKIYNRMLLLSSMLLCQRCQFQGKE